MCAINGITAPNAVKRVEFMNSITERRGPEGSFVWSNDKVTLGHNLLATMGNPQSSIQPMHYNNSSIVFNGAIFNWKEIDEWNTKVDTELLLKGLDTYGMDFLDKCEGMWAFAWSKGDKLVLCRDSFGIKPLYYRATNEGLIFSSSPHALENKTNELNLFAFSLFRDFGYVPGPITLIDSVLKLVPGGVLTYSYSTRKLESSSLWKKPFGNFEYDLEEFKRKLKKSIELSAVTTRQRGVFLSGGLDSTSVLHYLNEKNSFTTHYTNCKHAKSVNDDADCARKLAEDYGLNHTEIEITQDSFLSYLTESVKALEMPTYNKNNPSYLQANKAMRDKETIITYAGDGGDEMYTGYGIHGRYPKEGDPFRAHYKAVAWKGPAKIYCTDNKNEYSIDDYSKYMQSWFPSHVFGDDFLNNCLFIEMLTRVSEDFLARNDRFGAYYGMEGRFPLLNKEYYYYIMGIPSDVKMSNPQPKKYKLGEFKFLARHGLKDILPDYIINKKKTGWAVPVLDYMSTKSCRLKIKEFANQKTGTRIDNMIKWDHYSRSGTKYVLSMAYFKEWVKAYNVC